MSANGRDLLDSCVTRFGRETVDDIRRIYSSLWGRDAYRWKEEPLEATRIAPETILEALLEIAKSDDAGRRISAELAQALRYSNGIVDPENIMQPISPVMLFDIAGMWHANLDEIDSYLQEQEASDLVVFRNLWAEWNTYLAFIDQAQSLTGLADVDSFSGLADNASAGRYRAEQERQAHCEYEMADLIAFKNLNTLMRIQPADIEEMLRRGDWDAVLHNAVLAYLFGEGRFYQSLKLLLDAYVMPKVIRQFNDLLKAYTDALQIGYRRARLLDELDVEMLKDSTRCFLEPTRSVPIEEPIDFDEAWMIRRQKRMRIAEHHLASIEKQYAHYQLAQHMPHDDPAGLYGQAMTVFVTGLEQPGLTIVQVNDLLAQYRQQLLGARAAADVKYQHDYFFWRADGEPLQQVKSRSLHPRYQLYHVEAYAERIYLAALLALKDGRRGPSMEHFHERYQYHFDFDEAPLYVQKWIATYGPRRAGLFGYQVPPTVDANAAILAQDRWVHKTRRALFEQGVPRTLWGAVATGYTERLRHLLLLFNNAEEIASLPLEELVRAGDVASFTNLVRKTNPYDKEALLDVETTPLATIGVHVHNTDPTVLFETLVHVREVVWSHRARWSLIGTTTSQPAIARREHSLALRMGITRFGITNRQLLKAGNQNRIIPNTPTSADRESCYLTLDDDYLIAPLALQRATPVLLLYPQSYWVQFNLLLRAGIEPGHTHARHFNAIEQHDWTMINVFSFQDSELALPLGTNTLFRTTPGKSDLSVTGGFVVDPRHVVNGEDFAQGVTSYTMHLRPDLFAETTRQLGAAEQAWQYGIYIPECWAIGDGVDFGPGNYRQKARYGELNTRIFRSIWLPYLWRSLRHPSRQARRAQPVAFFILTYQLCDAYLTTVTMLLGYFLTPLLAFTPYFDQLHVKPYLALLLWGLWVIWMTANIYFRRPLHQLMGLSLIDIFGHTLITGYASLFAWMEGWFRGAFFPTQNNWSSYKGTQQSNRFRLPHLLVGIFHIGAACYALAKGLPIFLSFLLIGLMFCLIWFLQEPPPTTQHEKIRKIARDARHTLIKQTVFDFTHRGCLLGSQVESRLHWHAKVLQWIILPAFPIVLTLIILFTRDLPLLFRLLTTMVMLLTLVRTEMPLWNQTRTINRRQALQRRIGGASKAGIIQRLGCRRIAPRQEDDVLDEIAEIFVG